MKNECIWKDDGEGNYETKCGDIFTLIEGTPSENRMKFCPYCGRTLRDVSDPADKLLAWDEESA